MWSCVHWSLWLCNRSGMFHLYTWSPLYISFVLSSVGRETVLRRTEVCVPSVGRVPTGLSRMIIIIVGRVPTCVGAALSQALVYSFPLSI